MVRRINWLVFSSICAAALIGGGCGASSKPPAPPKQLASLHQGKSIGEEEALEFGAKLAEAMSSGDRAKAIQLFDMPAMIELITGGLDLPQDTIKGVADGLAGSFAQTLSDPFGTGAEGGPGGRIAAIRSREKDGVCWLLLRMVSPEQAIQYAEIALARRHRKIWAVDMYNIIIGERVSQVTRNLLIQAGARQNRGLFDRLTEQEREFVEHSSDMEAMAKAKLEGRWRDGLAACMRFPDSIRNSKVVSFYRITFAQALMGEDEKGFLDAVADFRSRYPEEPGINLIAIDAHLLRKEYDKALECIDWMDKSIGGDPYLNITRANVEVLSGDMASAKKLAIRASEALPDYPEPVYSLVDISLTERAFGDTLAQLRKLRDEFGIEFPGMATNELFADFIKSPEYQEWIKE